ncbi:MAG: hypothetical protein IPP10_09680 [Candidatus Competibacteraceae bacterium]|nr:hypothetical protein [Candidatus Competibacteraceae bacterium]MBK9951769.1 hypothetical protein [Candidatus Competibacteraceae bacterium]
MAAKQQHHLKIKSNRPSKTKVVRGRSIHAEPNRDPHLRLAERLEQRRREFRKMRDHFIFKCLLRPLLEGFSLGFSNR